MKATTGAIAERIDLRTKFRPRNFGDLFGCNIPKQLAARWLTSGGKMPKGILISGDLGMGKSLFAELLAKAAACAARQPNEIEACGKCRSCQYDLSTAIVRFDGPTIKKADKFMELFRQYRESGVQRSWMENDRGQYLPILIDEIHEMNSDSQKLLRLELDKDWNDSCFLIGTTHQPQDIDKPLRDRMYPIVLKPPMRSEMAEWVQKTCGESRITVTSMQAINLVVHNCEGRFRAILNLLQQFHDLDLELSETEIRNMMERLNE